MAKSAARSWDDQKLIEALNERVSEYETAVKNWSVLFRDAIGLLESARPFVEYEVQEVGAKPDIDLLEAIDVLLKAARR